MISESLRMKITAAVLSAIFSGSYISCAVIEAVSASKKEMLENESISISVPETENKKNSGTDLDRSIIEMTVTVPKNESVVTTKSSKKNKTEQTDPKTTQPSAVQAKENDDTSSKKINEAETDKSSETSKKASEVKENVSSANVSEPTPVPKQSEPTQSSKQNTPSSGGPAVPESSMRSEDYFNSCVFIGDSHVEGIKSYMLSEPAKSKVLCQSGMNITRIAETIPPSKVAEQSPEHIYIMMGTNGIGWLSNTKTIPCYTDYLHSLEAAVPGADIYVMSIPPVSAEKSKTMPNSEIVAYNDLVYKMCEENGWHFLDVHSVLTDSSGCLENSADGIHIQPSVFRTTIKNYLLTHIA